MFFSTLPTVAEGFQLKLWRGGPQAGKPKVPPVARGLLDRGLMRLDTTQHLPRLFFTEAGLAALRAMVADRRLANPKRFLGDSNASQCSTGDSSGQRHYDAEDRCVVIHLRATCHK
jgi:hypothetical protein